MKTTLINVLLFLAGYILLTFAGVVMGFGFWIDWMTFHDAPTSRVIYMVAILLQLFSIWMAWISIKLTKMVLFPGLLPWNALRRGAYIKHEGVNEEGYTIFRMAPFDADSPVIHVKKPKYAGGIDGFPSYRYYFDGKLLHSAIH